MRKLSSKSILTFRLKSRKGKETFAANLKLPIKPKVSKEGGGDYWISSLSAISNSYKDNSVDSMTDKISELHGKITKATPPQVRNMYQRNIGILNSFLGYDLKRLRPGKDIEFLKKDATKSILTIKGLEIETDSRYAYVFKDNKTEKVGAIWLIAKLEGYEKEELGLFADILFRYLKKNFSKKYELDSKYCLAVDVMAPQQISFSQVESGIVPAILDTTLEEIRRLL